MERIDLEHGRHKFRVWKVLMQSTEGTGILYFYMPIRKVYMPNMEGILLQNNDWYICICRSRVRRI
jgi:hypothetical protein